MPLVRYEVRCEHSLANPELYRTAGRDDSEGLLEGVAMAGLVGIVRQLGDLAEFAAEIFHDLHDDIIGIVSRGQSLKARVARLEADLPAVEKALLAEASQFRFAYSARSQWRAPLPMDQNLCAQGELPRFVRNFYDDCRGPPRLFLLDKFDEAGRGACVKRYTDPTFFRISWAATEMARAEQLRREQEAQLQKKHRAAAAKGAEDSGPKVYARERLSSALFENLEGFTGDFTPELRSRRLDRVLEIPTEGDLTPDGPRSPEDHRSVSKRRHLPEVSEGPTLAPLKISVKDMENAAQGRRVVMVDEGGALSEEEESSADYFVDALTTMGSESGPDSEPGSRGTWEDSAQRRFSVDSDQGTSFKSHVEAHRSSRPGGSEEDNTSFNHSVLKAHVEANRSTPPRGSEEDRTSLNHSVLKAHVEAHKSTSPGGSEEDSSSQNHSVLRAHVEAHRSTSPEGSEEDHTFYNRSVRKAHGEAHRSTPPGGSEEDHDNPVAAIQWESEPGESQDEEPPSRIESVTSVDVPEEEVQEKEVPVVVSAPKVVNSDKVPHKVLEKLPSLQSHESVSLLGTYRVSARVKEMREARAQILEMRAQTPENAPEAAESNGPGVDDVKQVVDHTVEQTVTTPRSRRLWAKDNGAQVVNILSSNGGSEFNNILRARMLESSGEEDLVQQEKGAGTSSSPSSPYTNISSDAVEEEEEEEDGYTSSASSSPKGANFGALLSPSESPPRIGRGLMGSPGKYDMNPALRRKSPPPITPFLSFSPSVSRCPSVHEKPPMSSTVSQSPRLPPQLISAPQRLAELVNASEKLKNVPLGNPRRGSENGGSLVEPSRSQPSALPNPVPRPRTWVDRSESNVAATLRAIRQAAAVGSDDEAGSGQVSPSESMTRLTVINDLERGCPASPRILG